MHLISKTLFKRYDRFIGLLVIFNGLLLFSQPAKADESSDRDRSYIINANEGLPIYRRDGGSRSDPLRCLSSSRNLVALVPNDRVPATSSLSPNLFFYVPETNEPKTLEFVLRDETDKLVYEAFLTTNGNGIVKIDIPAEIQSSPLKTQRKTRVDTTFSQNYRWYLSLICDPQQRARDLVVEGWMRRQPMNSTTIENLSNVSDTIERAEIYQQQGFWYDALSTLAEGQETSVEQPIVKAKWANLLKSVGLAQFAAEPFIQSFPLDVSRY